MSRKIRTPKERIETLPLPAWTFALLTGADPGVRLKGWVTLAQAGLFGEPTLEDIWAQHRPALMAEASSAGFAPAGPRGRRPTGEAVQAWATSYLNDHRY